MDKDTMDELRQSLIKWGMNRTDDDLWNFLDLLLDRLPELSRARAVILPAEAVEVPDAKVTFSGRPVD